MNEEPRDPALLDASANREGRGRIRASSSTSMAAQWTAFLVAPAAFFAHLQLGYVLVPWSCVRGTPLPLHVAGAASVALALAGARLAWRVWSREGRAAPGEGGGPAPRARFVALCALMMAALFVLLLAVQWAQVFVISPCQ